jgi:2-hydroxy-6-oxonona-2,4-dienedioate hydrolase
MTRMVLATDPALVEQASPAEQRRVRDVLFRILPISARKEGLLMDSATAGAPQPYPVERINCPTLVISVRDDLYGTAAAATHAAERMPNARLILYDTGGHLWVGHDEEMWRVIADFIRRPDDRGVSKKP